MTSRPPFFRAKRKGTPTLPNPQLRGHLEGSHLPLAFRVRLPPRLEQLSSHADGPLAERGRLGSSLGRAMTATLSVVDRVTIADVLRLGGFEQPDRHGFLICPLHAERSGSFHVLGDGTGYRCFGCGAKRGVLARGGRAMTALAEFAERKLLPPEYLARRHVSDEPGGGIRFEYGVDAR